MINEMAIRKHVDWNWEKMVGYVDIGAGVSENTAPYATEALVFMAVAVNSSWKVPVGYSLVHALSGKEKANLVRQCLLKLSDIGIKVISMTCDAPA